MSEFPDTEALTAAVGRRVLLRAQVDRLGWRRSSRGTGVGRNPGRTVLLVWLTDAEGNWLRDHQWADYEGAFADAQVREGDIVEFEARIEEYMRESLGDGHEMEPVGIGYKLEGVTGVRCLYPTP